MADIESVQRWIMIENHLKYNFIPPIHNSFVNPAIEAIDACNMEEPEKFVKLPNGRTLRAGQIVEELRLEQMVNNPDDDLDNPECQNNECEPEE